MNYCSFEFDSQRHNQGKVIDTLKVRSAAQPR